VKQSLVLNDETSEKIKIRDISDALYQELGYIALDFVCFLKYLLDSLSLISLAISPKNSLKSLSVQCKIRKKNQSTKTKQKTLQQAKPVLAFLNQHVGGCDSECISTGAWACKKFLELEFFFQNTHIVVMKHVLHLRSNVEEHLCGCSASRNSAASP
jgi:hypothetical protein